MCRDALLGRAPGTRLRFARLSVGLLVGVLAAPTVLALVALNVVSLALVRPETVAPEQVDAALMLAQKLAWGPLVARVSNAAAGVARQRDDAPDELASLTEAAAASPKNASLAAQLAELRLAQGDREGAIRAWQTNRVLIRVPLERGAATTNPAAALDWFGAAQAVDPTDPRPFEETTRVLLQAGQPERAVPYLAQALTLGPDDGGLAVIARRLVDPFAVLDDSVPAPLLVDVGRLWQASQIFTARGDLLGAIYADELALRVDPTNVVLRSDVASLRRRLGRAYSLHTPGSRQI